MEEFLKEDKPKAWKNALIKKNLLIEINNEIVLTERAKEILEYIEGTEEAPVIILKEEKKESFEEFVTDLYNCIENKIFTLTGKKNFKNRSTKFLKSPKKDLAERLELFFKKGYKVDYQLIKKALLQYAEEAITGKNPYSLTLEYFIIKKLTDGTYKSEMLSFIEMMEDESTTINSNNYDGGFNL